MRVQEKPCWKLGDKLCYFPSTEMTNELLHWTKPAYQKQPPGLCSNNTDTNGALLPVHLPVLFPQHRSFFFYLSYWNCFPQVSAFAKNIVFCCLFFYWQCWTERKKKRKEAEQMMFPARLTVNLLRLLQEFQSKQFDSSRGRWNNRWAKREKEIK